MEGHDFVEVAGHDDGADEAVDGEYLGHDCAQAGGVSVHEGCLEKGVMLEELHLTR